MSSAKIFLMVAVVLLTVVSFALAEEEFKPSGKVWGLSFGDFYYKVGSDTSLWGDGEYAKTPKDHYAFAIRRVYLGYDYNISPNFSTQLILEGFDGSTTAQGDRTVFIKAMNLRWKNLVPKADILIGHFSMPTSGGITDKVWGYRSIEKTIIDFHKLGSSNDVGICLAGNIDGGGNYGYNLTWTNGSTTKPENNRLKKFSGEVYANLLNKKIIAEGYADYEPESRINKDKIKSKTTFRGFLAYTTDIVTVGFEGAYQIRENYKIRVSGTTKDTLDVGQLGISVYARGMILKDKLFGFARFDMFNPDNGYKDGDNIGNQPYNENFILAGIDYAPHKNVHIIPNLWMNTYSDKRDKNKDDRDPDIVPRVTFYYIFK